MKHMRFTVCLKVFATLFGAYTVNVLHLEMKIFSYDRINVGIYKAKRASFIQDENTFQELFIKLVFVSHGEVDISHSRLEHHQNNHYHHLHLRLHYPYYHSRH